MLLGWYLFTHVCIRIQMCKDYFSLRLAKKKSNQGSSSASTEDTFALAC